MNSTKPKNDRRNLVQYFAKEQEQYAQLAAADPKHDGYEKGLSHWLRRTRQAWRSLNNDGIEIPLAFLEPYPFPKEMFARPKTGDSQPSESPKVQLKYQLRAHNVLREFDRCAKLFPEVLDSDISFSILELSAGACGGAEVARHFGNSYQATDYLDGKGSAYEVIHKSLGLSCLDFDGSKLPYSFEDKSFDLVLCFQAIDAYGPEEQYRLYIDEMLRIARKKVVVIFNPGIRGKRRGPDNSYEKLIRSPLENYYQSPKFAFCPSTNSPAMILEPSTEGT